MQEKEREILITHMSNVNVTNNYVCDNSSTLNSRYIKPYRQPQCREFSAYIVKTVQF